MTSHLLPRIGPADAAKRLAELNADVIEHRPLQFDLDPHVAIPNATGGQPVSREQLQDWREQVRSRVGASGRTKKERDDLHGIALGRAIAEVIDPVHSDAAHDGVWSFLSLYVFPDIVLERWPLVQMSDGSQQLSADRWIGSQAGRDRNYLKLAWRRWTLLGELMEIASPALGEDEFGALLERSAVARNPRLVRAAAQNVLAYKGNDRMQYTRALMKTVCYQTGARSLDLLSDSELADLVTECSPSSGSSTSPFPSVAPPSPRGPQSGGFFARAKSVAAAFSTRPQP